MQYVEIKEAMILKKTGGAVLIEVDDEEHWVPWSCVEDNGEDFRVGTRGTIYISEWIAEREGIEYE